MGTMALLTLAWLLADPVLTAPYEFFALRASLVNLTGVLGLGAMSVVLILAMRPVALESPLGGLDKMYRLHKWPGITGALLSILHWLLAQGPKWMVGWGWMERPVRRHAPLPEEAIF